METLNNTISAVGNAGMDIINPCEISLTFIVMMWVFLAIYIGNTIWFLRIRKSQKKLSDQIDKDIDNFSTMFDDEFKIIQKAQEELLKVQGFENSDSATVYFKSLYGKNYYLFTETNPRYLFNLTNLRNHIDRQPNSAVVYLLSAFAMSWAKKQEEVFNDYEVICKQYEKIKEENALEEAEKIEKIEKDSK